MILSRRLLLSRMTEETPWAQRLVVEPFLGVPSDASSSPSLDFHLGNRFSVPRRRRAVQHDPLHDTFDEDITSSEFYVSLGEKFVIHPGQLVLGTTLEWYRFPADIAAYAIGRSIWGRRGLLVATATAVQPCSSGTITLELSNVGEIAVVIRPGAAIGQLFFHLVDGVEGSEAVHRRSPFTASNRPILGDYKTTAVERFLLGRLKRTS